MHLSCVLGAKAGSAAAAGAGGGKAAPGKAAPGAAAGVPAPPLKAAAAAAAPPAGGAPSAAAAAAAAKKGAKLSAVGSAVAGGPGADAAAVARPLQVPQADEDAAAAAVQWVMSARPETGVAAQQLREAWARVRCGAWAGAAHAACPVFCHPAARTCRRTGLRLPPSALKVEPRPHAASKGVNLRLVGRIAWAAALAGAAPLAEECASRAAAAQELPPRAWAGLARQALALAAAPFPEGGPPPGAPPGAPPAGLSGTRVAGRSAPAGGRGPFQACANLRLPCALRRAAPGPDPEPVRRALAARVSVLEGLEEALAAFARLRDVEGVHCAAKLTWNAGWWAGASDACQLPALAGLG
jgi:hypothetical protein